MTHIDPNISIDDNEKAVINKYGFELRDKEGHYELVDPVYRKANRGKGGKHSGGNLPILLQAAVAERRAFDESVVSAPPIPPKQPKAKKPVETETIVEVDIEPVLSPTSADLAFDSAVFGEEKEPEPETKTPEEELSLHNFLDDAFLNAPEPEASKKEQSSVVQFPTRTRLTPEDLIDPVLDNTGSTRHRITKKKDKPESSLPGKKKGAFKAQRAPERVARAICADLDIDVAGLMKAAQISETNAVYMLDVVWADITAVLIEKGWLKFPTKGV